MASAMPLPLLSKNWPAALPGPLRPLARAYLLSYASVVGPRLLALVLQKAARKREGRGAEFHLSVHKVLRSGLEVQRFPTFCAALIGGSTLLEVRLH